MQQKKKGYHKTFLNCLLKPFHVNEVYKLKYLSGVILL